MLTEEEAAALLESSGDAGVIDPQVLEKALEEAIASLEEGQSIAIAQEDGSVIELDGV